MRTEGDRSSRRCRSTGRATKATSRGRSMIGFASHRWFGPIGDQLLPRTCFVIMPISTSWSDSVWGSIRDAMALEFFDCQRADFMGGQVVMSDLVVGIARSQLLVADVTGGNANVFYEIGIAHAWELDVILIAQRGSPVIFDIQGFRHIAYDLTETGLASLGHALRRHAREKTSKTPSPGDIEIKSGGAPAAPGSEFLGHWEGFWVGDIPGRLSHSLVVYEICDGRASTLYFWGTCHEWQIKEAGRRYIFGQIERGILTIEWPTAHVKYRVQDNVLIGERIDELGTFCCRLSRAR